MYEIRTRIDSEPDPNGVELSQTTFTVEAVRRITSWGPQQTVEDAVELGITTAFMRFLRNLTDRMPKQDTLDLSSEDEVQFSEMVYKVRAATLESLRQAARGYLESCAPQIPQGPEIQVDWDAMFRGLMKGCGPDTPERSGP